MNIYFTLTPLPIGDVVESQYEFIRSIKYKGGIGKKGLPLVLAFFASNIPLLLFNLVALLLSLYILKNWSKVNKEWEKYDEELNKFKKESIKLRQDTDTLMDATKYIDEVIARMGEESIEVPKEIKGLLNKIKVVLYGKDYRKN